MRSGKVINISNTTCSDKLTSVTLHYTMIKSIQHKGLKLLWEEGKTNRLPGELISRIERMLVVIDEAKEIPASFSAFKNWNVHKLSGNLKDFWSIKVNKNYRLIFRFDGKDSFDLDFLDYH